MDPAFGAIIGAVIGALAVLAGGWLARKADRDRAETTWLRDRLLEAYSQGIYYSLKLSVSAVSASADANRDVRQHYAELRRFLLLLRAYTKDQPTKARLKSCSDGIEKNWNQTYILSGAADKAAQLIEELLSKDERVSGLQSPRQRSETAKLPAAPVAGTTSEPPGSSPAPHSDAPIVAAIVDDGREGAGLEVSVLPKPSSAE